MIGIDYSQLTEFEKQILDIAEKKYPREAKNFLQRTGNALKKDIKSSYGTEGIKKKTGNLFRGLSRGRAYLYHDDEWQVRVKNKAPHAWLIEHGHKLWIHHKQFSTALETEKRVQGYPAVADAVNAFADKYPAEVSKFIDEFLEKGFY